VFFSLLQLLHRSQKEAVQAGRAIKRIVVAYEAGRDGFWLGTLAARERDRSPRNPLVDRPRVARAPAGED
jgi:hypothetical protein